MEVSLLGIDIFTTNDQRLFSELHITEVAGKAQPDAKGQRQQEQDGGSEEFRERIQGKLHYGISWPRHAHTLYKSTAAGEAQSMPN